MITQQCGAARNTATHNFPLFIPHTGFLIFSYYVSVFPLYHHHHQNRLRPHFPPPSPSPRPSLPHFPCIISYVILILSFSSSSFVHCRHIALPPRFSGNLASPAPLPPLLPSTQFTFIFTPSQCGG